MLCEIPALGVCMHFRLTRSRWTTLFHYRFGVDGHSRVIMHASQDRGAAPFLVVEAHSELIGGKGSGTRTIRALGETVIGEP